MSRETISQLEGARRKDCKICKTSFEDKNLWLRHFLGNVHKTAAWAELGELSTPSEFCTSPSRIHSLVYVNCTTVSKFRILKQLSAFGLAVTNLIFVSTKPYLSVFQFSDSAQVSQLFEDNGAKYSSTLELLVDNKNLVKIFRAENSKDGKWKAFFCKTFDCAVLKRERNKGGNRGSPCLEYEDEAVESKKRKNFDWGSVEKSRHSAVLYSLDEQFEEIQNEIEIGIGDNDPAWTILRLLSPLPLSKFPHAQFHLFRHWYSRLRSAGTNKLHLFVTGDVCSENINPMKLIKRVLHGIKTELEDNSILASRSLDDRLSLDCVFTQLSSGPFHFTLTTNPIYLPEVQACRLLRYLREFDSRVTPLLTLVMYWSRSNDIHLGAISEPRLHFAPEPGALEWLVMFFLCEKRIIPTPRQVQARPHQPIPYQNSDLGFANTRHFVLERKEFKQYMDPMSNYFLIKVLQLAKEFFEFVASCGKKNFVLNTRDGNKIGRDVFSMSAEQITTNTTLLLHEVKQVKEQLAHIGPHEMFMIHPLHTLHSFSFNYHAAAHNQPQILRIATKIHSFLTKLRRNPDVGTRSNSLQNLLRHSL